MNLMAIVSFQQGIETLFIKQSLDNNMDQRQDNHSEENIMLSMASCLLLANRGLTTEFPDSAVLPPIASRKRSPLGGCGGGGGRRPRTSCEEKTTRTSDFSANSRIAIDNQIQFRGLYEHNRGHSVNIRNEGAI
jgi:hypothetical protein